MRVLKKFATNSPSFESLPAGHPGEWGLNGRYELEINSLLH